MSPAPPAPASSPGYVGREANAVADKYAESRRRQLQMNRQTWGRLTELGVTEETELCLEFVFRCPDQATAEEVAAELGDEGCTTTVARGGSLLRRVWSVSARTRPATWSLAKLDDWVNAMVDCACAYGSDFDGWGTEVPPK